MNDKQFFLDTNILIYAYSNTEPTKRKIIEEILEKSHSPVISTQVINEFINVMSKKRNIPFDQLSLAITELAENFTIAQVTLNTIAQALMIAQKYRYSYFDSLILASALESNCTVLYSEDMHHTQCIESTLLIHNPFHVHNTDRDKKLIHE